MCPRRRNRFAACMPTEISGRCRDEEKEAKVVVAAAAVAAAAMFIDIVKS